MRKLLIDDRIRGFAQQYASALQAEQPNVVSDLENLRDSVITFNAWADPTAPEKYINALIADYPAVLTLEPKDWNLNKYDDILKLEPDMLTRPVVYGYTKDKKSEATCSIKITKKSSDAQTKEYTVNTVAERPFPIIGYSKAGKNNFVWTKSR